MSAMNCKRAFYLTDWMSVANCKGLGRGMEMIERPAAG